jgi:hypothetical protein
MFWCLQSIAVAKTLSPVILAYSLGKLLEEAFSQLELVVVSFHALWSSESLHLVGNVRSVLYCSSVGLAFLCWSSDLPILFPASKNALFCFPFEVVRGRERVFGLPLQASLWLLSRSMIMSAVIKYPDAVCIHAEIALQKQKRSRC